MDQLINGIKSEKYYQLLDWKDKNLGEFWLMFERGTRLKDLTTEQLKALYKRVITN